MDFVMMSIPGYLIVVAEAHLMFLSLTVSAESDDNYLYIETRNRENAHRSFMFWAMINT